MGFPDLIQSLGDNPYFGAGFGLFGLGAGTALLRKSFMVSYSGKLSYFIILHFKYLKTYLKKFDMNFLFGF